MQNVGIDGLCTRGTLTFASVSEADQITVIADISHSLSGGSATSRHAGAPKQTFAYVAELPFIKRVPR